MARAVLVLQQFHNTAELAGRPLTDHLLAMLATAGVTVHANDEGPHVALDAAFATVSASTLTRLVATLQRGGGSLFTASGILVAAAHPTVDANAALTDLLRPVGEALRIAPEEALPVTDHWGLAAAEKVIMLNRLRTIAEHGVRVVDPSRVWIGHEVFVEPGAILWPDIVLRGLTRIAGGAEIQSGCWLQDTTVGVNALVKPHTVCDGARIGAGCQVGPMAHLRPGTLLEPEAKVGNFVETKNATLGRGAKASHLTYLGDAEIGAKANIGAGTITCNYDGFGKYRTRIGEGAFIGSNSALVAPVEIGAGAIIGAGSTIAKDVPEDALAVERGELRVLKGKARALHRRNQAKAEAKKAKKAKDG